MSRIIYNKLTRRGYKFFKSKHFLKYFKKIINEKMEISDEHYIHIESVEFNFLGEEFIEIKVVGSKNGLLG